MAELIPPRRNEFLTKEGVPTQRFAEYLERVASASNENTSDTSVFESLNSNAMALAGIYDELLNLELASNQHNGPVFSNIYEEINNLKVLSAQDNSPVFSEILNKINDLELVLSLPSQSLLSNFVQKDLITAVTAAHSTKQSEIVICNNTGSITVTLNSAPANGETVKIKRRDAEVIVSGSIDGAASKTLSTIYDSISLVYTQAGSEWSII